MRRARGALAVLLACAACDRRTLASWARGDARPSADAVSVSVSGEPARDGAVVGVVDADGAADAASAATPNGATTSVAIDAAPDVERWSACPLDMVLVEGAYCPDVEHVCQRWLDPPGPYEHFRCATYGPSRCRSAKRSPLRFCIDRDEYTAPGESLPAVHHSWTSARGVCEALGKRLCLESEWQFACEGEELRPYPYGFVRDATACNIDRTDLGKPNAGLRDDRVPAGARPRCVSPFGVRDLSGNVEEWATLDRPKDPADRSTMKGAWWLPGRNHCRAATTGHGETYEGAQVGVRCCKDAARFRPDAALDAP